VGGSVAEPIYTKVAKIAKAGAERQILVLTAEDTEAAETRTETELFGLGVPLLSSAIFA
jgi:hypothetical protein